MLFIFFYLISSVESSESSLLKVLIRKTYSGDWHISESSNLFYSESAGKIKFNLENLKGDKVINFEIRHGKWSDDSVSYFSIISPQYNETTDLITFTYNLTYPDKGEDLFCPIAGEINLKADSHNFTSSPTKLMGKIWSSKCDFSIAFECDINQPSMFAKPRVIYSFVLFCLCFMQSFTVTRFLEVIQAYETVAKKASILTWIMNAALDLSIVLFNIQEVIRDQESLESMMMGLAWSLISFYTIRSKLLMHLFKTHNSDLTLDSITLRFARRLVIFCNSYLDAVVVSVNLIAYQFKAIYIAMVPLLMLFYFPQIYKSAKDNMTSPFSPFIAFSMGASRMIIIVMLIQYIFLFSPNNPLQIRPQPGLFFFNITLVFIQTIVVLTQSYKARLLVPRCLLPKPYEYLKDIELTNFKECSICLNNEKTDKIMMAPCGHSFHEKCMSKWLEIKLMCPMCRKSLPIFEGK